jgi:hypothetical protein
MGKVRRTPAIGRTLRGARAAALLFAAGPLRAGDDDKTPAYKIYIDPETGKYTTQDPDALEVTQAPVEPAAAVDAGAPDLPLPLIAAGVIVALGAFVLISKQLKQTDSR